MARVFRDILIIYFVVGAVMWGGGLITFDGAKPLSAVFQGSDLGVRIGHFQGIFSNISGAASLLGWAAAAGLRTVLFIKDLIAFVHWPIIVLRDAAAPPEVIVLLGGTLTLMFYFSAFSYLTKRGGGL